MARFCTNCGNELEEYHHCCPNCGNAVKNTSKPSTNSYSESNTNRSKVIAGLLGIFLGGLGVHNFYLGYYQKGLIQLLCTLFLSKLTFGVVGFAMAVWGLVEGIQILTGSINVDAQGNPLC